MFPLTEKLRDFETQKLYFMISNKGRWSKGKSLEDCQKVLGKNISKEEFVIYCYVFKNHSNFDNTFKCFSVDGWGSVVQCDDVTDNDLDDINNFLYFHFWVIDEWTEIKFNTKQKKK